MVQIEPKFANAPHKMIEKYKKISIGKNEYSVINHLLLSCWTFCRSRILLVTS